MSAFVLQINVDAGEPRNIELVDMGVAGAPLVAGDASDRRADPVIHRCASSSADATAMASTSTSTARGKLVTPMAARAG
jgi:hypothetical protein